MTPILFCMDDSPYKLRPDLDVYDKDRNALTWKGGKPGIYHPPCTLWGNLKHFSKADKSEKFYALWSVEMINTYGGILEHPRGSKIWKYCHKGFILWINQNWFGHPYLKPTGLYIVGINKKDIPEYPALTYVTGTVQNNSKKWRSRTPEGLIDWMLSVIKLIEQMGGTTTPHMFSVQCAKSR